MKSKVGKRVYYCKSSVLVTARGAINALLTWRTCWCTRVWGTNVEVVGGIVVVGIVVVGIVVALVIVAVVAAVRCSSWSAKWSIVVEPPMQNRLSTGLL